MWANLKRQGLRKKALCYRQQYQQYLGPGERRRCVVEGSIIVLLLSLFFYRSLLAVPLLMPIYLLYQKRRRTGLIQKRRKETAVQFKDAILAVSANQKAGYSVENAFRQAYEDMVLLYGRESMICGEFYRIITGLGNNLVLERLLYDFGKCSGVEDILEFSEVFAAAKRNGGNLTEVIERSASIIEDKVETEREIQIMLSARRMEQKMMNAVPFGILLYIGATSRGFFDVLYHNLPGILIMTICLSAYVGSVLLSEKIVNIEV